MDNVNFAAVILQKLRERSIRLSIDDFGTGYSSLSYMHSFPVSSLKIDRSFVQRLDGNPENLGLIPAIISIAKTMGMSAIAEGIETTQQLNQLKTLGCDFGQGYLFSKPVEAQTATGRYANTSDYVRDLIRKDQERVARIAAMQQRVEEGLESGEPQDFFIDAFLKAIRAKHGGKQA